MLLIFGSVKSHTHTVENMIFLILAVILVIILTIGLFHYDQARWRKYKIYREMYFHKNPYFVSCNQTFAVSLIVPRYNYDRLMNTLMLTDTDLNYQTEALLQKVGEQSRDVAVKVQNVTLGLLEKNYATKLCESLQNTDFGTGRPIEVLILLNVTNRTDISSKCSACLDLPISPEVTQSIFSDQSRSDAEKKYRAKIKPVVADDPDFKK